MFWNDSSIWNRKILAIGDKLFGGKKDDQNNELVNKIKELKEKLAKANNKIKELEKTVNNVNNDKSIKHSKSMSELYKIRKKSFSL